MRVNGMHRTFAYRSLGGGIVRTKLAYSKVKLEDAGTSLSNERVLLHKDLTRNHRKHSTSTTYDYDYEIDRPAQMYLDPVKIVSPPDSASIILQKDKKFDLSLISSAGVEDKIVWDVFSSCGVSVTPKSYHANDGDHRSLITQNYEIGLKEGEKLGYLQFLSVADDVKYRDQEFDAGMLITFCFFKHLNLHTKYPYPPIYPIVTSSKVTYAPMLLGQTIQIISPINSKITYSDKTKTSVLKRKGEGTNGLYKFVTFTCQRVVESNETIYIQSKDEMGKNITSAVIVPCLEKMGGKLYPVIVKPLADFKIYCYNISGMIVEDKRTGLPGKYEGCYDSTNELTILNRSYKGLTQRIALGFRNKNKPWMKIKNFYKECSVK